MVDPDAGWTQGHVDAMKRIVAERPGASSYEDPECSNGGVFRQFVRL